MADAWNPAQYGRFSEERSRPFFDLLAMVRPGPDLRVVDLGCGTGELTRALHDRLSARETTGIEKSAAMLARSDQFTTAGLSFISCDIADWRPPGPLDVVFSNAALHWLPDHEALFARLASTLAPGGQLAVQMPANHDHPSHLLAAELAGQEPFRTALGGYRRVSPVEAPEWYAALLERLGFVEQRVLLEVYPHRLASRDDVVEWVRGTLLTDYLGRLPGPAQAEYLDRYRDMIRTHLPDSRPFFLPFKRLLLRARRG